MFRGNHPTRMDEKGRLKVPAEFKRVIDEKYGLKFYITSLDGKVAQLYPFEEWERIEQKLASLSTFNPTKKKFLSRVNFYGQEVEMDGQGRLLIPQLLRQSADIKGEVAVMGNLTYLEVRNIETLQTEMVEEKFTTEDESRLSKLGIWWFRKKRLRVWYKPPLGGVGMACFIFRFFYKLPSISEPSSAVEQSEQATSPLQSPY